MHDEILFEFPKRAVETVKNVLKFLKVGEPIVKREPKDVRVEIPVMYLDFAVDKVHYDPSLKGPSPKGRHVKGYDVDIEEAKRAVENALKEAKVLEGVEYREAERVWVVPVSWRKLIVMHVKVTYDGKEIVPDYGITSEVRRRIL